MSLNDDMDKLNRAVHSFKIALLKDLNTILIRCYFIWCLFAGFFAGVITNHYFPVVFTLMIE